MDKKEEERDVSAFLMKNPEYEIFERCESPDFIIRHIETGDLIGIEHTKYYPHRDENECAIVLKGRTIEEKEACRHSLFERFDLGYIRFAQPLDIADFLSKVIVSKEAKLVRYQQLHPECKEFWLIIKMDFFDDVVLSNVNINTKYDRVFFFQESGRITEASKT